MTGNDGMDAGGQATAQAVAGACKPGAAGFRFGMRDRGGAGLSREGPPGGWAQMYSESGVVAAKHHKTPTGVRDWRCYQNASWRVKRVDVSDQDGFHGADVAILSEIEVKAAASCRCLKYRRKLFFCWGSEPADGGALGAQWRVVFNSIAASCPAGVPNSSTI